MKQLQTKNVHFYCNDKRQNLQDHKVYFKDSEDQAKFVFACLMLERKMRKAMRFPKEWEKSGGVMLPGDNSGKP